MYLSFISGCTAISSIPILQPIKVEKSQKGLHYCTCTHLAWLCLLICFSQQWLEHMDSQNVYTASPGFDFARPLCSPHCCVSGLLSPAYVFSQNWACDKRIFFSLFLPDVLLNFQTGCFAHVCVYECRKRKHFQTSHEVVNNGSNYLNIFCKFEAKTEPKDRKAMHFDHSDWGNVLN